MNTDADAPLIEKAVRQINGSRNGSQTEPRSKAYWAYRHLTDRMTQDLGGETAESLVVEVVAEHVAESVVVSFVDTAPEIREQIRGGVIQRLFPTPTLVRVALGIQKGDPRTRLTEHLRLSSCPDEVEVKLSSLVPETERPATAGPKA